MPQFAQHKDLIRELKKCGNDPAYFIKTYCKIQHPQRGQIPFKTWDFQDKLLEDYVDFKFNIILKSRQLGISTLTAAYCAWLMLFHRSKNIIVVATQFAVAQNLVVKVKDIIKLLDPFLLELADIDIDNRTSFKLSNGSQIKAFATNQTVGRSEAASLVVLDEAAHIEGLGGDDGLWTALEPTMAAGGRCIALSSPNGQGNWFFDMYRAAERGENDFKPTRLNWDVHPERGPIEKDAKGKSTSDWWEKKKKTTSRRQRAQEYECAFNASGMTVIDPEDLMYMEANTTPPKVKMGFDRNLWVWHKYVAGKKYMILADVARGDGNDFSAFHVIEVGSMEQVAEYKGQLNTDMFTRLLYDTGIEYDNALIAPENNNLGHEVCNKLEEFEYPNIYYAEKGSHTFVEHHRAPYENNVIAGFTTSPKSRPLIIVKLEEYIRNNLITINSERTVEELRTFIWKNSKPEAQQGKNDDLTIALAIGCWIRDTVWEKNERDASFKKVALSTMTKSSTQLDTTIPGMSSYNRNASLYKQAQFQQRERKQFSWLFSG